MGLVVVFLLFIISIAVSLSFDISMIFPLAVGMILFSGLAVKKGFTVRQIAVMAKESVKESCIVIIILLIIGCLTGLWRVSGTVAYFVTAGISLMPASAFLLAAFLLSAVMSYAIGTSFGVSATAGVIIMSIARAGGVNPVPVAGAVLSGVYVGDRGSPAASSANLVAMVTGTDMRINIRRMLKTSFIPFLLCCAVYLIMSQFYPMKAMDSDVVYLLEKEFRLNLWCVLPAVIMIVLPFCRVKVKYAMAISMASSFLIGIIVQRVGISDCFKAMIFGYSPDNTELSSMLGGGGIASMLDVSGILLISGTYGGIFKGTDLLSGLSRKIVGLKNKTGRYPAMLILSVLVSMIFCNQTIGVIMLSQISDCLYDESEKEKYAKMLDIEDSVILTAGIVPWCIACSVPISMLGAGKKAILYGFYLWLVPLWNLVFPRNRELLEERP